MILVSNQTIHADVGPNEKSIDKRKLGRIRSLTVISELLSKDFQKEQTIHRLKLEDYVFNKTICRSFILTL